MARSLNRVQLIGNLTRDPELRYTPSGTAVCSFGLATNRGWTTDTGEKHEEAEFHRIVAWNKLAELCSQFLEKGRKVYLEGRLSTRSFNGQDGQQKSITEIVISDMILIDGKRTEHEAGEEVSKPAPAAEAHSSDSGQAHSEATGKSKKGDKKQEEDVPGDLEDVAPIDADDIPF